MALSEKTYNFADVIELERHIEILLLGNDCVVVPELGGFVAHHASARYDRESGIFLPPYRAIGFNPQLKMNDSLLVQSYVEAYDISYPEALRKLEKDVAQLRHTLDSEGSYYLNGIGELFTNDQGKLEFSPCEAGVLTPRFYGLGSFEMPTLTKSIRKAKEAQIYDSTESAGKTETSGHKSRIVYIDAEKDTGYKMLNIRLNALRNAAVAAVIFVAVFLMVSPNGHLKNGLAERQVRSGILYNMFNIDEAEGTKDKKATMPERKTTEAKKSITVKKTKKIEDNKPYWAIVLCSHVPMKNAQSYASMLENEGIKGLEIAGTESSAKVLYGRYPTEAEAYEALRQHHGNLRFKQGWVLGIEK